MIDLGLNQYKIKEIKYEVKENKIVTFKLRNFNLEDVTIEEIAKEETTVEEPDYYPFSSIEDYKKPVGEMKLKELKEAVEQVKECERKSKICGLSKVDIERCKELINALDGVPYKVMEKIGELKTNSKGEGFFVNEPDPYVVNDERELPKQKKTSALTEDEQSTLDASKKDEWKDSMKNNVLTKPIIVAANLDKKYESLSTGEKREVSKQIIEQDAKKDTIIIKERVENSIGDNTPLSEEVLKYPEKDFLKDKKLDLNDNE